MDQKISEAVMRAGQRPFCNLEGNGLYFFSGNFPDGFGLSIAERTGETKLIVPGSVSIIQATRRFS
jgi:hypothetical protein